MHIADLDRGMLGANGIVGAGMPLAVGAGLTCAVKKTGGVSVAFFGDGATNQGQFHEALNLAAIWKLPVIFVAENNGYGEATPYEFVTPVRDLVERARSYAMNAVIADGPVDEPIRRAVDGENVFPARMACLIRRFLQLHAEERTRERNNKGVAP